MGFDILTTISHLIEKGMITYDPFYLDGQVAKEWNALGHTGINSNEDAYYTEPPAFDVLVTYPPFSHHLAPLHLALRHNCEFAILMPCAKTLDKAKYTL